MTDLVLGMGEVGSTLYDLLTERNYECIGIDIDKTKSRNFSEEVNLSNVEFMHVCLPGELEKFVECVTEWIEKIKNVKAIIIHSTIIPGTTKKIQDRTKVTVIFSPVRGVHKRFLEDMKRYTKFLSAEIDVNVNIKTELKNRFKKIQWMSNSKTAELAKILVDTTYYGWLINYAQITKMICDREGIDFDEIWKFSDEIHDLLGNRPKMFPGIIGGHCVIPNLGLLNNEDLLNIKKINDMYKDYTEK